MNPKPTMAAFRSVPFTSKAPDFGLSGRVFRPQQDRRNSDRDVDGEKPLPGSDRQDSGCHRRSKGCPRRSHKRIQSQAFTEHLGWIGEADESAVLAHDPGCAETMKRPGERKRRRGMSKRATERSKRENDYTKLKHTPQQRFLGSWNQAGVKSA